MIGFSKITAVPSSTPAAHSFAVVIVFALLLNWFLALDGFGWNDRFVNLSSILCFFHILFRHAE